MALPCLRGDRNSSVMPRKASLEASTGECMRNHIFPKEELETQSFDDKKMKAQFNGRLSFIFQKRHTVQSMMCADKS